MAELEKELWEGRNNFFSENTLAGRAEVKQKKKRKITLTGLGLRGLGPFPVLTKLRVGKYLYNNPKFDRGKARSRVIPSTSSTHERLQRLDKNMHTIYPQRTLY